MLKRWDSVYEPGPAEGAVVQVEARPAHRRRRADVCPARPRQALVLLFRLHLRRLARRARRATSWCRSARPISASPTRNCAEIDRFVRNNTVNRFGPVREVVHEADKGLVLEVAFEGLQRSTRHRSGVAMRFPRISRLRWDKPPSRSRPAGDAGEAGGGVRARLGAAAVRHAEPACPPFRSAQGAAVTGVSV